MHRIKIILVAVLGLLLFLAAAIPAVYAQASSPKPQASASSGTEAIPAAQVATRASEMTTLLVDLTTKAAARKDIEEIPPQFFEIRHAIAGEIGDTENALKGQPTIERLQVLQGKWKPWQEQMTGWLDLLTKRSVELQMSLDRLAQRQTQWIRTRDMAHASDAPGATLAQIETVLNAITAGQVALRARHDLLLNLQSRVSQEAKQCGEILNQIAGLQKGAMAGILTRESRPIWDAWTWEATRARFSDRFADIVGVFRSDWEQYRRDPTREMPFHIGVLLFMAVLFTAIRRRLNHWDADASNVDSLVAVFEQPFTAAIFTTWLVATRYASPTPLLVRELMSVLAILPILRLVQPKVPSRLRPGVYGLGALYGLDILRGILSGTAGVEQVLLVVEGVAGVALLFHLLASGGLEHIAIGAVDRNQKTIRVIIQVTMGALAIGVAAGALGFMRLGRIVTPGILFSIALAFALYAWVRVFGGMAAVAMRVWPLRRLQMIRQNRELFRKWIYRVLLVMAVLGWAVRLVEHLGLLNPVQSMISALLDTRLERGTIGISLGDILAFVVTIIVSYLLSRLIRFTLNEEIYPRAHIPSGSAYAFSRILHYTILTLGFVVGLGLLGMDLTKVSVMAGALGVGIGFGLQNVVNNFVCGLILLFERPVHVGDIIDVGDLYGEVRHIGFRASTVRTRRGADIIIPNAEFITARVTNWTYGDRLRRIDLPVSVNYASKPKQVIEVLEEVARTNPLVIEAPAPRCLFMNYGDSSINFELRVWTDQSIGYNQLRSGLNTAVYDAVQSVGMDFPFPQREVRLLRDSNGNDAEKK